MKKKKLKMKTLLQQDAYQKALVAEQPYVPAGKLDALRR